MVMLTSREMDWMGMGAEWRYGCNWFLLLFFYSNVDWRVWVKGLRGCIRNAILGVYNRVYSFSAM